MIIGCFITMHGRTMCLSGSLIVEKGAAYLILLYIKFESSDYE